MKLSNLSLYNSSRCAQYRLSWMPGIHFNWERLEKWKSSRWTLFGLYNYNFSRNVERFELTWIRVTSFSPQVQHTPHNISQVSLTLKKMHLDVKMPILGSMSSENFSSPSRLWLARCNNEMLLYDARKP